LNSGAGAQAFDHEIKICLHIAAVNIG